MFINGKYINENNINIISFKVVEDFKTYLVYKVGEVYWTFFDDCFHEDYRVDIGNSSYYFKEVSKGRIKDIEMDLDRARRYEDNYDVYRYTQDLIGIKEEESTQEIILRNKEVAKYYRKIGHLEITFDMGSNKELKENILKWDYLENFENEEVVVEKETPKEYTNDIDIIEVKRLLDNLGEKKMI